MFLESAFLKRAELKFKPYQEMGERQKRLLAAYQTYLSRIETSYSKAVYWHGTGRYHYRYKGNSRYTEVTENSYFDVLESILTNGGLVPHLDPWIPSGGKTVSLGTVRMHSRLFALAHRYQTDILLYELGSMKFWIRLYGVLLLLWLLSNLNSAKVMFRALSRPSSMRDLQVWTSTVRNPKNGRMITLRNLLRGVNPGSDILGNYPLLFGVSKQNLEVISTLPLTHKVEVRTLHTVGLQNFTHVEVPLNNMKETEEFLKRIGVSLEVLPLEFVDMYLSTTPLRQLAYTD